MTALGRRIREELRAVFITTTYFACWVGWLSLIKHLLLAEYTVAVYSWTAAIIGTLLLSKVVLVLERVPLGRRVRAGPPWVEVALRTVLYMLGVIAVLIVEAGVRGWREHGGFGPAVAAAFAEREARHMTVNATTIGASLLLYNTIAVVRRRLGRGALIRMLLEPVPDEPPSRSAP